MENVAQDGSLAGERLGIYTRASADADDTLTSVTGQEQWADRWGQEQGCVIADRYCDNDKSASWFATKPRPDFERLLADIAADRLDLVWFWTLSRSQRDLGVFVRLRSLCREHHVRIVVKRRVYDLSDPADLRALGNSAVDGEVQSLEISENVKMGLEVAASAGRPHGKVPYGYRRVYDGRRRFVAQVPDEVQAPIVVVIFEWIAAGKSISALVRYLEERGILSPRGRLRWERVVLVGIATNLAYIGKRVFRGEVVERDEPCWQPLVSEDLFYRVQAILKAPDRLTSKPGRAVHLLSYLVLCSVCDGPVCVRRKKGDPRRMYACYAKACAAVSADELDDYVRRVIEAYLGRVDVRQVLISAMAEDTGVVAARTDASRLRVELEANRKAREAGDLTLDEFVRFKRSLEVRIVAAEERAKVAGLPPILRAMAVDWGDVAVARQVVAATAEIKITPIGRGWQAPVWQRVKWRWLIGPDAEDEPAVLV